MHFRLLLIFLGVVAAVAGRTASLACADDLQLRLRLRGKGSVSIGHGTPPSFGDTLDGGDQLVTFVVPFTVTDARGSGAGWSLTLTSTAFRTRSHVLGDAASTLTGVAVKCVGTTCTSPVSSTSYPVVLPAGKTAPPPIVFLTAAAGTGMGAFDVDPSIELSVPGSTYAGKYKSTLTFAVTTGP